ncbi:MAG: hypothetical protein ACYC9W_07320 [Candidatus Limnocylindria bacterium]
MTHVEVSTLKRLLTVRYDPAVTTAAAVSLGIDAVISNIGR